MDEKLKTIISDEIKVQRFKKKLTQMDMANVLNITRDTYRKLENDPSKINFGQALIISYTLNWNLYDFVLENAYKI